MRTIKLTLLALSCVIVNTAFADESTDKPSNMPTPHVVPAVTSAGLIQSIYGIAAAMDGLAMKDHSYAGANVTPDNIQMLMPNNTLTTPWGSPFTINNQTKNSYVVTFVNIPSEVCKETKATLSANKKFTIDSNCDSAEPADFSYKYTDTPM
jgi:hypothetical protein